ncbi:MAG: hypothetical protein HW388_1644 [Dehalococcoidia bacterium]|nr:hypothetical protein [Dehalococcoidia bacterium]
MALAEPYVRTPLPGWSHTELLYETIDNGRIAIITMNRPERLNAMGPGMRWEEAWINFASDENCWVAIVTGVGDRAFSAGADLTRGRDEGGATAGTGQPPAVRPLRRIVEPIGPYLGCWKPTIAAINGYAIGFGFATAQNCTFRIAAEHAEMGIAEARWNQGGGFASWVPRLIGSGHALEICIMADRRVSAQRAYEMGFVNKVVPKEQLMDEAVDWARTICEMAPRAVRDLNELIHTCWNMSIPEAMAFGAALTHNLQGMEDSVEGRRAFAEKRKPVFKNR